MLDDAMIERYSRQILLPEVGGRGQERLCAARVVMLGAGAAAAVAADLLRRAGVDVSDTGPDHGAADVVLDLAGDPRRMRGGARPLVVATLGDAGGVVDTWRAGPCATCTADAAVPRDGAALAAPAAMALGALAAAETLIVLLGLRTADRRQTVDLAAGILSGEPRVSRPGCPACAGAA